MVVNAAQMRQKLSSWRLMIRSVIMKREQKKKNVKEEEEAKKKTRFKEEPFFLNG